MILVSKYAPGVGLTVDVSGRGGFLIITDFWVEEWAAGQLLWEKLSAMHPRT